MRESLFPITLEDRWQAAILREQQTSVSKVYHNLGHCQITRYRACQPLSLLYGGSGLSVAMVLVILSI